MGDSASGLVLPVIGNGKRTLTPVLPLGQPTKAGSYATGVSYYPNGGIAQFTYGNGIVHSMTQNDRQLPERSRDVYGSTATIDDSYDYDGNGNVAAISDALPAHRGDRTMGYDGLDRLVATTSPMYGTGASYTYDVLDNLTRVKTGGTAARDQFYCYDPATWRLTNVKTTSCSGSTVIGLGYDVQGNLANKNGVTYAFDFGNRLRTVSDTGPGGQVSTYVYDGHGRRVHDWTGASKYSQYSSDGRIVHDHDYRTNKWHDYIQLGGSLVAILEYDSTAGVYLTKYQHTDALGSPVAVTNQARTVLERSEFEPYGKLLNRPLTDGPGYTGHVSDAATGLSYMQQRYYDPAIGRFLSVDPVTAYEKPITNFNRYLYARNNPYKFTDPDGRDTEVELQSYIIGNAPIQGDYGHQYVRMRDTDTGEVVISRAGPSAEYPGGSAAVISRSPVKDPGGNGNVKLVTEMKPAARSSDSDPATGTPLGKTVPGSAVTLKEGIDAAKSTLQKFNSAVDAAKIDYKPLSTNSNAYAGTAYTALTGKAAPSSSALPGSDVSLKRQVSPCERNAASCGK